MDVFLVCKRNFQPSRNFFLFPFIKSITKCAVRAKRAYEKAIRTTITMPPRLMAGAEAVFMGRGFAGFCDYLQELVRSDVEKRKPQLLMPR